jgi:hypothetical protein
VENPREAVADPEHHRFGGLLVSGASWNDTFGWATTPSDFQRQRLAYYDGLRAYDRWSALLDAEEGPEADLRRKRNAAAREADPTLGGFATLEACGPDGLVPDAAARRSYFGE